MLNLYLIYDPSVSATENDKAMSFFGTVLEAVRLARVELGLPLEAWEYGYTELPEAQKYFSKAFKTPIAAPSVITVYVNDAGQKVPVYMKGIGNKAAWQKAFVGLFQKMPKETKEDAGNNGDGSKDSNGNGTGDGDGKGLRPCIPILDDLIDLLGLQQYRQYLLGAAALYFGYRAVTNDNGKIINATVCAALAYMAIQDGDCKKKGTDTDNSPLGSGAGTSFIGKMELSKGLRNNNPLNIHVSARAYSGKVTNPANPDFDTDGKQLERFETFEYGLKAGSEHLLRYFNGNIDPLKCYTKSEGKLNTISKILNRWVCGLNPAAYVAYVERETGINRNAVLDLNDKQTMTRLIYAMTLNECGVKYKDSVLNATDFQKYMAGALAL